MVAVVAGFHRDLSERLLEGARAAARRVGAARRSASRSAGCPGAFELPLAARTVALTGRYAAVIALGVVIRGETAHFDHICHAASSGLAAVGLETGVPCAFGVLTTENRAQAEARSGGDVGNAGADAADAAVVMANLIAESATTALRGRRPPRWP